jgi:hypothetical protein
LSRVAPHSFPLNSVGNDAATAINSRLVATAHKVAITFLDKIAGSTTAATAVALIAARFDICSHDTAAGFGDSAVE